MVQLTNEQRERLTQIANGESSDGYLAAVIILNLARGKDRSYVARVTLCTPDEVAEVESLFESGGLAAIEEWQPQSK